MIIGLGTDLIEIKRIEKACERVSFVKKTFTEQEYRQAGGRASFFAGNFATKEALVKALGVGFRSISPRDVEVLRDDLGKPYIVLYNEALNLYNKLGCNYIHVSISNLKEYANSVVILEK